MTILETMMGRYCIETNKQMYSPKTEDNQLSANYKCDLPMYSSPGLEKGYNHLLQQQQQQHENEFISLTAYHNDVVRLASYYEQILKTYGKVELEALAYRISAACHSYESPKKLNSIKSTIPTNFQSNINASYECQHNSETSTATFHSLITYQLRMHLINSKSFFFNQLPCQSINSLLNINHHLTSSFLNRLSCKIFVGGVPVRGNQVTTWTRDQLHKGLSIFGPVSLIWPKGTIVIPTVIDGNHYNQAYCEVLLRSGLKRGYCYALFNDPRNVTHLLSTCSRRTKGFYINLSKLCPELEKSRLDSLQIIPWDKEDSFCQSIGNEFENYSSIKYYKNSNHLHTEQKRPEIEARTKVYSIFVGALHGMITARALFTIFNDLFGNVCYAALDTDKYHYPIALITNQWDCGGLFTTCLQNYQTLSIILILFLCIGITLLIIAFILDLITICTETLDFNPSYATIRLIVLLIGLISICIAISSYTIQMKHQFSCLMCTIGIVFSVQVALINLILSRCIHRNQSNI
ncbi:Cytoplasmic polyadenylation element-binding protein [Schistosoma japonicum]|nr:Cytoplasmic polyadenylation element-binding protein [Schistosoma japonicum]